MIQLASRTGLDSRTISTYEAGEKYPSFDSLLKMENALGFPRAFFVKDDPEELTPESVSFRSMSRMTSHLRDMALSQGKLAVEFMTWLEKRFDLPKSTLPELRHEASNPEAAAESLRRIRGLGQMSIRNMIHLLEANGIRVFSLSIEAKEVDAFAIWEGTTPIVMLNGFKSAEHSRFDAAHELGHLVLHRHIGASGNKQAEAQADAFASAFLKPGPSVRAQMPRFTTVQELIRLKKIWGVSVSALNGRIHRLGLTSDWQYRALCVELSKRGYRSSEPEERPRESSIVLPKLLLSLYQDDGLTRGAIARELAFPISELNDLLFGLTMSAIDGYGKRNNVGRPALERIK